MKGSSSQTPIIKGQFLFEKVIFHSPSKNKIYHYVFKNQKDTET